MQALARDRFDIVEDFEWNCTPRLRREVRQIVFEHFDQIIAAWREHFGGDRAEQNKAGFGKGNRDHSRRANSDHGRRGRPFTSGGYLVGGKSGQRHVARRNVKALARFEVPIFNPWEARPLPANLRYVVPSSRLREESTEITASLSAC